MPQPLENAINSAFVPALTGLPAPGKLTRDLLALPCKLGGSELINPTDSCSEQHRTSKRITQSLNLALWLTRNPILGTARPPQLKGVKKNDAKTQKRLKLKNYAEELKNKVSDNLRRSKLSQEKGASIWLTALPIDIHGFALHKSAFRDGLSLRYNWPIENKLSFCSCGHTFSIDHALSCPTGGFPSIMQTQ